jgi:hypothetical protein
MTQISLEKRLQSAPIRAISENQRQSNAYSESLASVCG